MLNSKVVNVSHHEATTVGDLRINVLEPVLVQVLPPISLKVNGHLYKDSTLYSHKLISDQSRCALEAPTERCLSTRRLKDIKAGEYSVQLGVSTKDHVCHAV